MSDDNLYTTQKEDPAQADAMHNARKTFKFLWRELSWEYRRIVPGLDLAVVKAGFANDDGNPDTPSVEYMWIGELDFDGLNVTGVLINQPNWVSGVAEGDEVSVPLDEISDWMYAMEGKTYGGYTVQAMRAQMSESERDEHDTAWGLDFGDANAVQVSPHQSADDASTEHPMSINMVPEFEKVFRESPAYATQPDDTGWTLLQREALAGNVEPVKLLLQYGADVSAKNPNGHTALELATMMGWPEIIKRLSYH